MGFTGFYRVLPGFTGFSMGFTGFQWVLLGFSGFYWVLLGFTGFSMGFTEFQWVLLGFTGFYRVFHGFLLFCFLARIGYSVGSAVQVGIDFFCSVAILCGAEQIRAAVGRARESYAN